MYLVNCIVCSTHTHAHTLGKPPNLRISCSENFYRAHRAIAFSFFCRFALHLSIIFIFWLSAAKMADVAAIATDAFTHTHIHTRCFYSRLVHLNASHLNIIHRKFDNVLLCVCERTHSHARRLHAVHIVDSQLCVIWIHIAVLMGPILAKICWWSERAREATK